MAAEGAVEATSRILSPEADSWTTRSRKGRFVDGAARFDLDKRLEKALSSSG